MRPAAVALCPVLAAVSGCASTPWTPPEPVFESVAGLVQPELVAFNPEDDLTARVTGDGRYLTFVSERNGNLDVWVRDFGRDSTYPLTQNPADDFDPAVFPTGDRLVFVSRRSDAKGDLFISSGLAPGATVERLTDASTQDRQPVVAPDGRRIFFTAAVGIGLEFIAEIDIETQRVERRSPTPGFDPAISPDGRYLVYTAPGGPDVRQPHLVVLRLADSATRAVTRGEAPEGFATFAPPTTAPYSLAFVRFADDDNGDGQVDARDQASLWRVDVDFEALFSGGPRPRPYPLTDGASDELFPDAGDGRLYFTQGSDQQDILRLPPTGIFPEYDDPRQYLVLAKVIDDPRTRWFALRSAVAKAGPETRVGARALLAIGRLHEAREADGLAERDYSRLIEHCRTASTGSERWAIAGLAKVALAGLDRQTALRDVGSASERAWTIGRERRRLEDLARTYHGVREVVARIELEKAELLIAEGERTRAVQALNAVGARPGQPSEVAARAMLRRIELLGIVHDPEALTAAYARVTARFPDQIAVVTEAADRVVELYLKDFRERGRLDALRRLVVRFDPGPIRTAARWKLVTQLRARRAMDLAAVELVQVVEESTDDRLGRARALRALAEVNEARGADEAAVATWRELLRAYADLPGFASAARSAISRVNRRAAAISEGRGDLESARQAYRRVIDNDVGEVEAHRRYLALSARLGKVRQVLTEAERRAEMSPGTPVARYAFALALTYRLPPALDEALEEVEAAIGLNPQFTQAYLLRGWIREMQELEEPGWFMEGLQILYERVIESVIAVFASDSEQVGQLGNLELAIEDYKTALRLNDESLHPKTEAEILLNLGNGHYRLADATNDPPNMRQAFNRYTQVLALRYRFDAAPAELVFWERFGRAASWASEHALSAMATRRALAVAERIDADDRTVQLLGNLALAYDQANEEAYAQATRRILAGEQEADAAAGRTAVLLREKARARLSTEAGTTVAGADEVLRDLSAARAELDRLDGDPRELPTVWLALDANPTSAQYGFSPLGERNVNLALAEQTHRALADQRRADALAALRSQLALDRFEDIPGGVYGFINKWPNTLHQVRERLGLILVPAFNALREGRWKDAARGLKQADDWLTRTVDGAEVSGSKAWLQLERARWCALSAAWQALARAEGWPGAPADEQIEGTVSRGFDAVGVALSYVATATAGVPLDDAERERVWAQAKKALPADLSTVAHIVQTASVARVRPVLDRRVRGALALQARLLYARGLSRWADSLRDDRSTLESSAFGTQTASASDPRVLARLLGRVDRATAAYERARADFDQSVRLAAGAGPGLGHRVMILALAAWADVLPSGQRELADEARRTAVALAEATGHEALSWSVRFGAALRRGGPAVDTETLWPGFVVADLPVIDQLATRTASAALARGQNRAGFDALEQALTLRAAAGPLVELDNRQATDDAAYTRELAARIRALDRARRVLAESEPPTEKKWRRWWADVEAARVALRSHIEDGPLRLSAAALARVLGGAQSAEALRFDLGANEGMLMPANIDGALHLLFIDGSTTTIDRFAHVAVPVAFEDVQADVVTLRETLQRGQRPGPDRLQRLVDALFAPLAARLNDKETLIIVGGFLGTPIPQVVLPEGPMLTHVHSATSIASMKPILRVGGRGTLRIEGADPPLVEAAALSTAEVIEFRAPLQYGAAEDTRSLDDRRPVEVLPDQVLDVLVVEAPVRLEPAALERSPVALAPARSVADAFMAELPLARLAVPAAMLVLARTDLAEEPTGAPPTTTRPSDVSAALRLDATLAVAGFPTTVVVPMGLSEQARRAVVEGLTRARTDRPLGALARTQAALRASMPEVDLVFMVGAAGMDGREAREFADRQLNGAKKRAVTSLTRRAYREAVPRLERWIRLRRTAEDTRGIEGVYGALIGVLRDKLSPPRPARAADVQRELMAFMTESGADEIRLADARVELAHLLSRAHDFAAADREFSAALSVLESPDARPDRLARGWYYYALHQREQKAFEAAAEYLERAIGRYEKLGMYADRRPTAEARKALQQAGDVYLNLLSDPVRARKAYERIRRYSLDDKTKVTAELDLAEVARRQGEFIEAAAHVERAKREAEKGGFADLALAAQIEAANVAWVQGDYRLGQELCQQALQQVDALSARLKQKGPARPKIRPRTIDRRRIFALSVCGLVAMSQRDFDGAVEYLEEARLVAERLGNDREVATQLNNLGRVYLEFGRLEAAAEIFRRARRIDERLDDRYALAYDLRNLGRALALLGVRGEAHEALRRALAYAQQVRDSNNELRTMFALAQLDIDEGRPVAAAEMLRAALPIAVRLRVKELAWQIHRSLGQLAWADGDLDAADEALRRAVIIARAITGRSAPSEFGPDRFAAFDDLIRLKIERGDVKAAFVVTEEARRLRQIELLADRRLRLGPVAEVIRNIQQTTSATVARAAQARLEVLAPRLSRLWQPASPDALASRLPPDAAVLQYELTSTALIIFVLGAAGLEVRTVPVGASELRARLAEYRQQLARRADITEAAARLSEWLVEPVSPLIAGKRRLAFVLQDALRYVALPALPISDDEQLIDRFEIVQALNLSAAVTALAAPRGPIRGSIVALGAAPPPPGAADRPLPFAARELQVIAEAHPRARLVRGEAVTRARLLTELEGAHGVFHFAGHSYLGGAAGAGRLQDLLGGQLRTADGGVSMLDIIERSVGAELVVLSACSSLVGTDRPGAATGEDIISMAGTFHLSGAEAVVGSTLNVDDVATALLMKRFYRATRTAPVAAALRTAQRTVRTLYGHPAWWAGFALWVAGEGPQSSDSSSAAR